MQKTQTICLLILSTVAVGFSLRFLQSVLLPFVIALFVVIGIRPLLDYLQRRLKLNRFFAVGITFSVGLLTLAIVGFAILASINDMAKNSGAYEARLQDIRTWVLERTGSKEVDLQSQANEVEELVDKPKQKDPTNAAWDGLSNRINQLMINLVSSMSNLLSYGVMIILFIFFLLSGDRVTQLRPKIIDQIEEQVRKFLVMKTVISVLTGLAFGGVLWVFGVPLAVLFGVLAFLLNFIPNIGPLVANVLPIPFLILNSEIATPYAVLCIVLITAVQFISGNIIETRIMGKSFDVSPIVLLLGLMFFGLVWGIVGMFLATPLVSIIKIALENTKSGKPIAELIAGRWTPAS